VLVLPVALLRLNTLPSPANLNLMPFDGLRVLSLESRRAPEIEKLIRNQGGEPFVAPSMREVPIEQNTGAFEFAERLFRGQFDVVILLTGVGTRLLNQVIETRWPKGAFAEALRRIVVVVRGPKPAAVMREWSVPAAITVPEPNTWRELLSALDEYWTRNGAAGKRIAIQEYGRPSQELLDGLRARGAQVTRVPVYRWELPEDCGPLRTAVRKLVAGEFDVVLFTTSAQAEHLLRIAAELCLEAEVRAALRKIVIASIGPTTSETLVELGIPPGFEPSHPKMGFLVTELARDAQRLHMERAARDNHA
jgi:uroporphyrinogen-III synthase